MIRQYEKYQSVYFGNNFRLVKCYNVSAVYFQEEVNALRPCKIKGLFYWGVWLCRLAKPVFRTKKYPIIDIASRLFK